MEHASAAAQPSPVAAKAAAGHRPSAKLTAREQQLRREWFRQHLQDGVHFNRLCGMTVQRWDPEQVELHLPFSENLTGQGGIFHGGVIAALIDTCGSGSVMAGHDFDKGSRFSTVSMAVQFLASSPGDAARAVATCFKRGRTLHFTEVAVFGVRSGQRIAAGQVTFSVFADRPDLPPVSHRKVLR